MQDRTELTRYEKELLLRAQELEYEDRHARLQQELRERLTCNGELKRSWIDDGALTNSIVSDESKTQEDVAAEGAILSEMLEIVAKRDSLIALSEEYRQRSPNDIDKISFLSYTYLLLLASILAYLFYIDFMSIS